MKRPAQIQQVVDKAVDHKWTKTDFFRMTSDYEPHKVSGQVKMIDSRAVGIFHDTAYGLYHAVDILTGIGIDSATKRHNLESKLNVPAFQALIDENRKDLTPIIKKYWSDING